MDPSDCLVASRLVKSRRRQRHLTRTGNNTSLSSRDRCGARLRKTFHRRLSGITHLVRIDNMGASAPHAGHTFRSRPTVRTPSARLSAGCDGRWRRGRRGSATATRRDRLDPGRTRFRLLAQALGIRRHCFHHHAAARKHDLARLASHSAVSAFVFGGCPVGAHPPLERRKAMSSNSRPNHSDRITSIGSTRAALHAGTHDATKRGSDEHRAPTRIRREIRRTDAVKH